MSDPVNPEVGSLLSTSEATRSPLHILQRLELAIVSSGFGVFEVDLQTGKITWDAEVYRIHGVTPETFVPTREKWREFLHPDDRVFGRAQFDRALDGGPIKSFEIRIIRRSDRSVRFVESTGRIQYDDNGKPLVLVGLTRDITARKNAEMHNQTVTKTMTMIAEKVPLEEVLEFIIQEVESTRIEMRCTIYVLDSNGETFQMMAGRRFGKHLDKFVRGVKIDPKIGTCSAAAALRQRVITLDTQSDPNWTEMRGNARAANVTSVWCEPIMAGDRILGTFAMNHPTRQEPMEEDLQMLEACAKLAAIAIQHSQTQEALAIQQAKLMSSVKMAALGEMASGIAHEINNPLTIIVGKAWQLKTLVEDGCFNDEIFSGELGRIVDTSNRIAKVIKGLQSFSRNAERDPLEVISASQPVEDAVELSKERFRNHGVELRIVPFPEKPLKVSGRPAQLTQVLLNLLNNAFDAVAARSEKWVEVVISCADDVVRIGVTDSGPGFSEAVSEKIMQPFFTTKEVGKGTGLGLSISKGIIEDHNGRLYFDPRSPRTCFVVELPVVRSLE